jgi:hypothetical protein
LDYNYASPCRPMVEMETEKMLSDLVSAYRATDYVAFNGSRVFLVRIGHHSLVIDALLSGMKMKSGAFFTAWNPFSKSQSAGVNAYWDRELKSLLKERLLICTCQRRDRDHTRRLCALSRD